VRSVEIVLGLVVFATVVATFAGRLRAPAPSLLVLAGFGVGLIPGIPDIRLGPSAVSLIVLPPLIYSGATDVALNELRRVATPIAALALGLVAVTAAAVAAVVHGLAPAVPLRVALVLGAVLASTDPVAVGALARVLRLPSGLLALVQGESLLNDATGLVLFRVALSAVVAGGASAATAAGQFGLLAGGGMAVGAAAAMLARLLRRRTEDPVLITVLAVVTPYAVYVGAESIHVSGVTAVVVAGLAAGRRDPRRGNAEGRIATATVYEVLVFLLESVVFALIGLQLPTLLRRLPPTEPAALPLVLAVTGVLLLVRMLWVAPTALVSKQSGPLRRGEGNAPAWKLAAVATWAGTRGVVPLAAALSIPLTAGTAPFPHRDLILLLASGVIVVSLVVQGMTLAPLVRRLGVSDDPARLAHEEALARHVAALAARDRLEELLAVDAAPVVVADRLRRAVEDRLTRTQARLDMPAAEVGSDARSTAEAYRSLRRDLIDAEAAALLRMRDQGRLGEGIRRQLQAALDAESTGLR